MSPGAHDARGEEVVGVVVVSGDAGRERAAGDGVGESLAMVGAARRVEQGGEHEESVVGGRREDGEQSLAREVVVVVDVVVDDVERLFRDGRGRADPEGAGRVHHDRRPDAKRPEGAERGEAGLVLGLRRSVVFQPEETRAALLALSRLRLALVLFEGLERRRAPHHALLVVLLVHHVQAPVIVHRRDHRARRRLAARDAHATTHDAQLPRRLRRCQGVLRIGQGAQRRGRPVPAQDCRAQPFDLHRRRYLRRCGDRRHPGRGLPSLGAGVGSKWGG
mmetsp:Transcript_2487/g.7736  ORF Transcript_2487/g.7736 Transcript_2487/m.7736 type:complete len:277 (+) Transcript_2487:422-1252(+)